MTIRTVKKAIFPVGGLGTRFLPATKSMPKEMLPIHSKPMIQHAFEEAVTAGIEQFIFITGRNKSAINDHFDYSYELEKALSDKDKRIQLQETSGWLPPAGSLAFIRQREPLGLGHAVWCARHFIGDEPFAVLLADEVYLDKGFLKQMVYTHEQTGHNVIAVDDVPSEDTSRYGIVVPGDRNTTSIAIKGMIEKPHPSEAPSNVAIVGRYILTPRIFDFLEEGHKGAGGEIQLTDSLAQLVKEQDFTGLFSPKHRYDCGHQLGYLEANIAFALQDDPKKVTSLLKQFIA
ncbi:MAG: UTP--glucose-1-phosphate uridylyltransferase GalU [Alphaproteobacteria bacterium]|nr:UTP--glucose-1-phosphate uridylyltransferase GalU [Alphaproteobacteria bacterium]